MVKKKRAAAAAEPAAPGSNEGLMAIDPPGRGVVLLLAATMFLVAALGSPVEEMLQDTLKSIVVSFGALLAAMLFFYSVRHSDQPLRWHAVLWLPLLLCAYALGSMAWSHTYLAGVEAVRWFVFAVLAWLGLNTFTRERAPWLAWGIHLGGVVASLWTALQFWVDLQWFPQGPNPGSTFVNRNFFAEFAVCTLPFGAWLLARTRSTPATAVLAATTGLTVLAVLMTGTRAGLLAMWLLLLAVLPLVAWRFRGPLALAQWSKARCLVAAGVFLAVVVGLGLVPSGNRKILDEERGANAVARGIGRTASIQPGDHSLGIRMLMWKATARVIAAEPLTGVGAGAWEVQVPRFQERGAQLETDYYVHNEFLQLVAEYGVAGWLFLLLLAGYLAQAAWRTWRLEGTGAEAEGPVRSVALAALLALFICSSIGFPWRLAATGALFALGLGLLAASDARLGLQGRTSVQRVPWHREDGFVAMGVTFACLALAVFITHRAVTSERKLVQAARLAMTVSASGNAQAPQWDETKRQLLQLTSEGVQLNPHYRKLTPIVADELAKWEDWRNAIVVWESVLKSRPYVTALISNVARGYSVTGPLDKAVEYMERARKLQPDAPAVRSLEVIVLARQGKEAEAYRLAKRSIEEGISDYDLQNAAFTLGVRARDYALAERAIHLRMKENPVTRLQGLVQLAQMYRDEVKDPAKALDYYRQAVQATTTLDEREAVLGKVPPEWRSQAQAR